MKQTDSIIIQCSKPIDGSVRVPGSKSITNRAILIASLASGESRLSGVLHSDDTHYMIEAWKALGAKFVEQGEIFCVKGCGGKISAMGNELYVENAGTAARFLTAALTIGKGRYVVSGNERMKKRPIKDLIVALNQLGADVNDDLNTSCPPVTIRANGLQGGAVSIPGEKSSQYISAIMLAAPYAKNKTTINIEGKLVSKSYVEMTQKIMADFGVGCKWNDHLITIKPNQCYHSRTYDIEADASSASYFFAMAAITKGKITVRGLNKNSTQGDIGLVNILEKMGCFVKRDENAITLRGHSMKAVDVDMNTMSDVAPTLAAVSIFAEGNTTIRNVENMRIKECDRISAIVAELRKLGVVVEEYKDGLKIHGGGALKSASIETYNDHRMAMAMALAGLKIPGVEINDPACVSKTYPGFFKEFSELIRI